MHPTASVEGLSQTTDLSCLSGLLPLPLFVFLRWLYTLSLPCPSYAPAQPWLMAHIRVYQHQPPSNDRMKYSVDKDSEVKPQFGGKE